MFKKLSIESIRSPKQFSDICFTGLNMELRITFCMFQITVKMQCCRKQRLIARNMYQPFSDNLCDRCSGNQVTEFTLMLEKLVISSDKIQQDIEIANKEASSHYITRLENARAQVPESMRIYQYILDHQSEIKEYIVIANERKTRIEG